MSIVGMDGKRLETPDQTLSRLIQSGAELVEMEKKVGAKIQEIQEKAEQAQQKVISDAEAEASVIRAPFLKKLEEYRAEVKKEFGITDGERSNVVQMMAAVYQFVKRSQ